MTANVITYHGRAVRDVGKALGFSAATLGKSGKGRRSHTQPRAKFAGEVEAIQDLPRHLGQHSGSMVICRASSIRWSPAATTMPNRVVVRWTENCAIWG
jgi:error-prone DNA polymerase